MKRLFFVSVILSSCATHSERDIAEAVLEAQTSAMEEYVFLYCEARTSRTQACGGLTFVETLGEDLKRTYTETTETEAKEFCQRNDISKPNCDQAFKVSIIERLFARYPRADHNAIQTKCKIEPINCSALMNYELLMMMSHNEAVQRAANEAVDQKGAQLAAENSKGSNRWLKAFAAGAQGYSNSLNQNRTISCTSNKIGSMVQTNCD